VAEDLRLAGVLETVLYYASDQHDEMERFYKDVLSGHPPDTTIPAEPGLQADHGERHRPGATTPMILPRIAKPSASTP